MGGRALKNTFTRRYDRAEFDELSKELTSTLEKRFGRVGIPLFYKTKESFGDVDILVTDPCGNARTYIEDTFHPTEIFHNGNCWSFDYKEIQVDLIIAHPDNFDTYMMYLSYNDLGNYIGRIAQGFGLKYGTTGLWYEHDFKNQNIGTVPVSKNYPKIFEFLGLDYKRWEKGFDTLEDIFKFIAYSPYFNWEMYQLISLNKINRDRNAKRASYMSFLEWIDDNIVNGEGIDSTDYAYPFGTDKTKYFGMINSAFPEAKLVTGTRKLEYEHCKKLYIKSKFSGSDVMKKYGFEGKELGEKMTGFKAYIESLYEYDGDGHNLQDYDKFILECDETWIYEQFELYLQHEQYKLQTGTVTEG